MIDGHRHGRRFVILDLYQQVFPAQAGTTFPPGAHCSPSMHCRGYWNYTIFDLCFILKQFSIFAPKLLAIGTTRILTCSKSAQKKEMYSSFISSSL